MHWKIIALAFGWRTTHDDDEDRLVVRHPKRRRHFTGAGAWRGAVLLSIRAPARADRKEARP
ncbi:hypothetical protein [Aminobacter aminovorans]|uniref:Uncharacterized protein n=1 Tax=Aminobacter aminovorans TaxID=83263 RepID=A0AAC9FER5_AMIAI|nr:hypothetical protein [Aminobacter aminovorans]AMS45388.1 hypothetical protein AA2016_6494 [Aminobacter aminovorans]MBB3708866.1 hypothetical protein [Aminobacter aminovorans]